MVREHPARNVLDVMVREHPASNEKDIMVRENPASNELDVMVREHPGLQPVSSEPESNILTHRLPKPGCMNPKSI